MAEPSVFKIELAVHKVFVIRDLLLKVSREVDIVSGKLVLCPGYACRFLSNTAYLGVVQGFPDFRGQPSVRLDPFYKVIMSEDATLNVEEPSIKNLLPIFFKTIYTGSPETIATALREPPFSRMEQLADVIEPLKRPYDVALRNSFRPGVGLVKIA